ncbi:MAG: hypothetical protein ABSB42_04420 [Tepidisphaeraceae bacterium]|jgi:hypothetical protein
MWHQKRGESSGDFEERVSRESREEDARERQLKIDEEALKLKERQIKALEALAAQSLKPLRGTAKKIAQYIIKYPGKLGDIIALDCGVTPEHFRRVFREKLRPAGFTNYGDGEGYFPPTA